MMKDSDLIKKALLQAISYYGSQRNLAMALHISQQKLNQWLNRNNKIPYEYALKIELLTGGFVSRFELAPSEKTLNLSIDLDTKCYVDNQCE